MTTEPLTCMFCGVHISRRTEHAVPAWLMRSYDARAAEVAKTFRHNVSPVLVTKGGKPVIPRSGKWTEVPRVMAAVCSSRSANDCNNWLEKNFEHDGEPVVRQVLSGTWSLDGAATRYLARWAIKTLLVMEHPETDHRPFGRAEHPMRLPDRFLGDMRRSGEMPPDVSLWMYLVDNDLTSEVPVQDQPMPSRLTRRETGPDGRFRIETCAGGPWSAASGEFGSLAQSSPHLGLQILVHPLGDIEHPASAGGLVTQLWPNAPQTLTSTAITAVSPRTAKNLARCFTPTGMHTQLKPDERLDPDKWPGSFPLRVGSSDPTLTRADR